MKKKTFLYSALIVIVLTITFVLYNTQVSKTRVATVNFPDFSVEKMIRSNNNNFVKIESVDLENLDKLKNYDMILVRIHGSSLNATHFQAIENAINKGIPVFSTESDNEEINTLQGQELRYVTTLMDNGSVKNNQSLFNYIRKKIDNKKFFNKPYEEPVIIPSDYFFHLGDDNFFNSYEAYQKFYESSGKYKKDAPRIALLLGNINLQNSNEDHIAAVINTLEEKGLNVYPISSFGMKKLGMIQEINPNLIINNPHGRLVMGMADAGEALLKNLNIPILAPVTVSELHDTWLKSKQGMQSGGLTSMSVVLPELDGAVAPFAIAAQFERNGYNIFDEIPGHTEKFCSLVKNYTDLQTTSNSEKKIAIYYYKGVGKGTLSGADLEGVQSLYNTLTLLKKEGYNLDGLPGSASELETLIQKQGSVLGAYALGAYDEFLKNGNPELVEVSTFMQWANEALPRDLVEDMRAQYGEAPGKYMAYEEEGKQYIAVARLQFGNVTILPQPIVTEGSDLEAITHGVDGAPSYPYVASYLWTRKGFNADALIHFGTHGSLEFIPGKQIALSDYDWTDALVGDMPHFYIYTINNIGEGIIAKRRSYATLIDHLTAPFMQGELYGELDKLVGIVHRFEHLEEGEIKQEYRKTITQLAKNQNICNALGLDSTRTLNNEEIEKVHIYLEEINGAKVTDGLYTLGERYTEENAQNTAYLMVNDAIKYSLASLDVAKGKIDADKLDNISFISHNYTKKADQIIQRAFKGEEANKIFNTVVSPNDAQRYHSAIEKEKKEEEEKMAMMRKMMGAMSEVPEPQKFLDDNGDIIDTGKVAASKRTPRGHPAWIPIGDGDKPPKHVREKAKESKAKENEKEEKKEPSMMESMAMATPQSEDATYDPEKELIEALRNLKEAIAIIAIKKEQLKESTTLEQRALITALNGGYILPSSAGDPIVNPSAVPTGRNFYAINPETTPSAEAWKVGKRLANDIIEKERETKGAYPEKVSFTLWSTDFISSEGASIAQILWMLGVEPLRDGFGYIRSLKLVPIEELGRPRIDVVVQTSGQLRDIAASRLALINKAVEMAANANDGDFENFVAKGLKDAEVLLLEKGFSPAEARQYSKERIFGGARGNYGTGIMGMVEDSENWDSQSQIATQYLKNMSGIYSANGSENWGEVREGVFEAALLNTSVVVQPRSSNTWGPLSLDHVYEFMGGLSAAVTQVTGEDPTAYFNDYRNTSRAKVQELKEAIGVETNSTIFNPKYITEKMKGEASSYAGFAETVRNTFGWNAMKPSAIDEHIWDEYYEVYVKDKFDLQMEAKFSEKNPYALQEVTAVMLESARKGMWDASQEQIETVAELHTKLVVEHEAGCSGFICDNNALRQFIAENSNNATEYNEAIKQAREVQLNNDKAQQSVVLEKEEKEEADKQQNNTQQNQEKKNLTSLYIIVALLVALVGWVIYRKLKQ